MLKLESTTLIVSSTEPKALRDMADEVSTTPEEYGADMLILTPDFRTLGIQRKKFPDDLLASMNPTEQSSNRLGKQTDLMRELDLGVFLFEGRPRWTSDGESVRSSGVGSNPWAASGPAKGKSTRRSTGDYGRLDRKTVRSIEMSLAHAGFPVVWVDGIGETQSYIKDAKAWWSKPNHSLLDLKPMKVNGHGKDKKTNQQNRLIAALQVVPGIGPKMAREIAKRGRLELTAEAEQLELINGLGGKKLTALLEQFGRKEETV